MKTFEEMEYHPDSEALVQILCDRTMNSNPLFFRVLVAFYWCQLASMMRATIRTHDRGDIPVNMYALNLSTSGSGKGMSTNIMEKEVISGFRRNYMENTFPVYAEKSLEALAQDRASRKAITAQDELVNVEKEFKSCGQMLFNFDSGTPPATKQLRHKMLMANTGSINFQVDEIGLNFLGIEDMMTLFLELFDVGAIRQKLVKNTADNIRGEEIIGLTPTNMLMFGTPNKLLDGGKIEESLYSMLETGYGRRCFFGFSQQSNRTLDMTPEQIYDMATNPTSDAFITDLSDRLSILSDTSNMHRILQVDKAVSLLIIEYRQKCERIAAEYPEHEEIKKAEMSHRYFKALKLAGAYAFIDDSQYITEDHLYYAIKLAEESGDAFNRLMTRERAHVKLAKFICSVRRPVSQADLVEDCPFYRGSAAQKSEMLNLAIAWGHSNNMIIKKSFDSGVEFLRGEMLEETNVNEMTVSYGTDYAQGYLNETVPFDDLHVLTQQDGYHWVNHHLKNGLRKEEYAIPGFNILVLDIDGTVSLDLVRATFKDHKYLIYTTKRHTEEAHRFRLIFPTNFKLKLDAAEFAEFMTNVEESLPFEVDASTGQRARKWASRSGHYEYNDGILFDVLPLIPKTKKNEERRTALLQNPGGMDALERWMLNNTGDGNRNNMLHRYSRILVDAGMDFPSIQERVLAINSKMADKLDDNEIYSTILSGVPKAIQRRDGE